MRAYNFFNRKHNQSGVTLTELMATVVISSVFIVGLGAAYVFFWRSWKEAEALVHMYESASYIIKTISDGMGFEDTGLGYEIPPMGGRSAAKLLLDKYGRCPCEDRDSHNRIKLLGPVDLLKTVQTVDSPQELQKRPKWVIEYYHDPSDSSFWYYFPEENERDVLIPNLRTYGGDLHDDEQERTVFVDYLCMTQPEEDQKFSDTIKILRVELGLSNKYGESIELVTFINLRNPDNVEYEEYDFDDD
jgi:prepilin-type N-terminal cleavage/methylation domain-containing protein